MRYQYMINRKNTQYLTLYVNHNTPSIYCAVGPKSFNAVMVRKTTAQSERHTKFVDLLEWGGVQTPKTSLATGLYRNPRTTMTRSPPLVQHIRGNVIRLPTQRGVPVVASQLDVVGLEMLQCEQALGSRPFIAYSSACSSNKRLHTGSWRCTCSCSDLLAGCSVFGVRDQPVNRFC